jgi:D-aspartate ligase
MRQLANEEKKLGSWLAANRGRGPVAVILGGSWNALSFARSLGRRGIPVLVLESHRFLGTYTRYGTVLLVPPADEFPETWINLLENVSSRLSTPGIIFATGDVETLLLSQHTDVLGSRFRFLVPTPETVERIVNKRLQYDSAKAAGIPVPKVSFPDSTDDLLRTAAALPYPVLLKPYEAHIARRALGQKVVVAATESELVSAYEHFAARALPMMVQEIIPGDDSALFGYLALFDRKGRELAWLTKRKLRQYPPQFGDGSLQVTVDAPEVAELSRRLLGAFDYCGFVGVEFKFDERDGAYYLMEINPRTVSGNQLAISAGVDFPWIGYQHLIGSAVRPTVGRPFRPHVRYVNEEFDIFAYLALRRTSALSLKRWLSSLRGTEAWAIGAWDDPLPLLVGVWRFVRLLLSRGRAAHGPRKAPAQPLRMQR